MKFNELQLVPEVLKAIDAVGYESPTPIQEKSIPIVLDGRDMLGCAQTGTGKTAAFAIPIIQLIHEKKKNDNRNYIRSLIITPTRELAIQIEENIKDYSKFTDISHAVIFGGVNQNPQVKQLKKGVDILVATPGRLLDLIGQGFIDLSTIEIFVLDEADRMLDMGFINDIKKVLKLLPEERQSLFFSATMPSSIVSLSKSILKSPEKIEVTPESTTAETIQQFLYYTNKNTKHNLLVHIIKERNIDQVLVFSRTKFGADKIVKRLKKDGISAAAIHGNKAQNNRQKVLNLFKEGKLIVLVATDIAARGIDIDKLKFVINYDIPNQAETYVHRIGRSGRAGEDGVAISISEPEENAYIKDIEKLIDQKIEVISEPLFPQTDKPMTDAEKKEWNKEKQRKKQEFFANRKKGKSGSRNQQKSSKPSRNSDQPKRNNEKSEESDKPKSSKPGKRREKPRNNSPKPKGKDHRGKQKLPETIAKKYKWPLE